MKLVVGLLWWFVSEHLLLMTGIVAFVALAVFIGTTFPRVP